MNIFLLLLSLFNSTLNSPLRNSDIIPWSESRKLSWDDFKGQPDKSSSDAALTNALIVFNYSHDGTILKFDVHCNFDKTKSWGRIRSAYVLSHEQRHFDIAELFARKLYKALSEYKFHEETVEKDLDKLYQDIMLEHVDRQHQYDSETDYSRKPAEQKRWAEKIEKELSGTRAFANYN